jgi:hypothetical protein
MMLCAAKCASMVHCVFGKSRHGVSCATAVARTGDIHAVGSPRKVVSTIGLGSANCSGTCPRG